MNATKMAAVLMMVGLTAVPAAAQNMDMSGRAGGMMDTGMMQMCHAMMGGDMDGAMMHGGDGAMKGHAGMMAEGGMEGMKNMPGMTGMAGMKDMPGMSGMSGMMGMMQGMGLGPAALLGAADRLQLTADQKSRFETLAQTVRQEHQNHMQAIMSAHQDGAEMLKADSPDLGAYQQTLKTAADHMVQAHMAMTRATVEARGILTEEQRAQLQDGMALMGSMMCGKMGGGE